MAQQGDAFFAAIDDQLARYSRAIDEIGTPEETADTIQRLLKNPHHLPQEDAK